MKGAVAQKTAEKKRKKKTEKGDFLGNANYLIYGFCALATQSSKDDRAEENVVVDVKVGERLRDPDLNRGVIAPLSIVHDTINVSGKVCFVNRDKERCG